MCGGWQSAKHSVRLEVRQSGCLRRLVRPRQNKKDIEQQKEFAIDTYMPKTAQTKNRGKSKSAEASGPGVLGVTSSTLHLLQPKRLDPCAFCVYFPPPARLRLILPHVSAFVPSLFAGFWCFSPLSRPLPHPPNTPPPRPPDPPLRSIRTETDN